MTVYRTTTGAASHGWRRHRLLAVAAAAAAFAAVWTAGPVSATGRANVVVLGLDQDRGAVPRLNRVYVRVRNALVDQLQQAGFAAYDGTQVALQPIARDADGRLADAAVLDAARMVESPPLDLVVLFRVYPRQQRLSYTQKLGARVEARLLNLHSGYRLGNFEAATPQPQPLALSCDHDCQLEHLGSEARILAQHVGAVLAARLDAVAPAAAAIDEAAPATGLQRHYDLTFNNFSDQDIADIEELLVSFSGYQRHRPVRCQPRFCRYWYENSGDSARLRRNLQMMLVHLDIAGTVTFAGNAIVVEKITLPAPGN